MHSNVKRGIILLTVIFLVALGANAFAGWGRGSFGKGGPGRQCPGWGYDRPFYGRSDLNEADWKKLDQERQAFFKETETLRQQIYEKEMALASELAKATPDSAKAAEIQKALSELQGQFDLKHLDHVIKMRQINPNAGRGYMMGRGRGYGKGGGRGYMMGGTGPRGGGYGPGSCWR